MDIDRILNGVLHNYNFFFIVKELPNYVFNFTVEKIRGSLDIFEFILIQYHRDGILGDNKLCDNIQIEHLHLYLSTKIEIKNQLSILFKDLFNLNSIPFFYPSISHWYNFLLYNNINIEESKRIIGRFIAIEVYSKIDKDLLNKIYEMSKDEKLRGYTLDRIIHDDLYISLLPVISLLVDWLPFSGITIAILVNLEILDENDKSIPLPFNELYGYLL